MASRLGFNMALRHGVRLLANNPQMQHQMQAMLRNPALASRCLSVSSVLRCDKALKNQEESKPAARKNAGDIGQFVQPSNLDKFILVQTGMYDKKEDIPKEIRFATMLKGRDLMRVYVSVLMLVFAAFGCVIMVVLGRRDAKEGDSLFNRSQKWIEKLRKEAKEEKAAGKV
ncbi:hypothetical protein CAPTEDRAFT_220828 [Capitella teleta]|uniref:Uncharacterized protein n=1 Tax=Capitella teleta TaxID=283909 RepID=R7U2I4_CAPTE|nr:hypothetical protein CAPTEDRAFT_220828 [Capitella teleta]|eukprot:ELU00210.1 hypothetical protein CAPTEDRAFT_220828 [Capitella teleta]